MHESPFSARCRDMGANCGAVDAVVAAVRHDLGEHYRHGLPDPGLAPASEPTIDGVPTAVFGRDIPPWSAAAEPPENAVDDRTILLGRSTSAAFVRVDGQQALENTPFCFGEIAPAQTCLQKAALNQSSWATSIASTSEIP